MNRWKNHLFDSSFSKRFLWGGIMVLALIVFLLFYFPFWDKRDQKTLTSYLEIIEDLRGPNPDSALTLAEKGWALAQSKGLQQEMALFQYQMGWIKLRDAQFQERGEEALVHVNVAMNLYKESNDLLGMAKAADILASCHNRFGRIDSVTYYLQQSNSYLSLLHNKSDSSLVAAFLLNTQGTLQEAEEDARRFYEESNLLFSTLQFLPGMAMTNFNLGTSWAASGELAIALKNIQRAQEIYLSLGWDMDYHEAFLEEGNIYIGAYRTNGKDAYFQNGKTIYTELLLKDTSRQSLVLYKLGRAYHLRAYWLERQKIEESKVAGDSARFYYQQAVNKAELERDFNTLDLLGNTLEVFCKDRTDCNELFPLILHASEEIIREGKRALSYADAQLRQAEQYELLRRAKTRQNQILFITGLIISLILIAAILLHQRQRIAFFRKQLLAKMQMLQAQMNPHFISNCMSAVDSLVLQNKPKLASSYLIKFSRLCRIILRNSFSSQITLEEEIQALRYYLSLEKLRMNDKLNYSFDIAEDLVPHSIWVPPSLIQPFVENAIWHGIQHKETPGHVSITISTESSPNSPMLQYLIEDDGVGRKKAEALKAESVIQPIEPKQSFGLLITKQRIELASQYPGTQVKIKDLKDTEGNASGTQVTIRLPLG